MRLRDHIDEDWILVNLRPTDKQSLFELLIDAVAARVQSVGRDVLMARLQQREAQCSTGIGHGAAVPHIVIEGLDRIRCVLAQIPEGLQFESVDDGPVHFVFLLLGPPNTIGTHLKLLARIARLIRRTDFVLELSTATSPEDVHMLVVAEDERHVD